MMRKMIEELKAHDDFLLISHVSPDGDTLGSVAALYLALKSMGKKAECAVDGKVPDKLRFLNDYCTFKTPEEIGERKFETAVAVDIADLPRMGKLRAAYEAAKVHLLIDHHPTNEGFGEVNIVEDHASTGEIILKLLRKMDIEPDEKTANALYAAISTDTGNFIYSNVTEETLSAAAYLRSRGADIPMLCGMIYAERSFAATKILGRGIENIKMFADGKIAATYIHKSDIEKFGALKEDTDCIINYAREIKGVEIAIFVNEQSEDRAKVSLRSNSYADVARFAVSFGGGGHVHAAGYSDNGTVEEVFERAVEFAKTLIK